MHARTTIFAVAFWERTTRGDMTMRVLMFITATAAHLLGWDSTDNRNMGCREV